MFYVDMMALWKEWIYRDFLEKKNIGFIVMSHDHDWNADDTTALNGRASS